MWSSSPGESPRARGQVEPTVALAAALVVGLALATFVASYQQAMPEPTTPVAADLVAERLLDEASRGGVLDPDEVTLSGVCPAGWGCNATLEWAGQSRSLGSPRPTRATVAERLLAVRVGPGRHRTGTLRVAVWR